MDKQERITSKRENKKAQINIHSGGVNIGGLVVIGTSLAIAGLVGTFFVHKTKRHFKKTDGPRKGDEKSKEVSSTIPKSEPTCHRSEFCTSYESEKMVSTQMDSSELVSPKSLILEDNSVPKISGRNGSDHQNILLFHSRSTTGALFVLGDACNELKLSPLSELGTISMFKTNHEMLSNSEEDSKEDFEVETDRKMKSDSQEHPVLDEAFESKKHVEELKQEDKDGNSNNDEKVEGGSDGTGPESNSETIWPAELLALDDTKENQQILEEKIVQVDTTTRTNKSDCSKIGKCDMLNNGGDVCEVMEEYESPGKGRISGTMVVSDREENGVNNGIWTLSLLTVLLCCFYYLPITTVCVSVLLMVVIYLYLATLHLRGSNLRRSIDTPSSWAKPNECP